MTNIKRTILYFALFAVGFVLWQTWEKDYPPAQTQASTNAQATPTSADVPPLSAQEQAKATTASITTVQNQPVPQTTTPTHQVVTVDTDVLHLAIDTQGGNLVNANLPKYPLSTDTPNTPITLLNDNPNTLYVAQSGLIGSTGPDTQAGQAIYTSTQSKYQLAPDQNKLEIPLIWQNKDGLIVRKIFTVYRGKYNVDVQYQIDNKSSQPWSGQLYTQLRQKPPQTSNSIFSLHTYNGAAISSAAEPYEKIAFTKMEKENLDRSVQGGWLAMQQRYFLSAWIPPQEQTNRYYSRVDSDGIYTIGTVGPVINLTPATSGKASATFYGGPEKADSLKALAPHLDLTVDYGWLWPISLAIFWVMKHIYSVVGNWGWAIVLVTLLIKLVFYKLSETSYRSMAKMRKLAPKLQALKDRYGDDRQKMSQATMELYKKEKANPLSGCLPILVQIPFFIALYYVLIESVELRQAPFILWIHDLSTRDPYFVLPILMGISMFLQQRLNPAPPDPMQAKIMMFLPVIFTIFFISFPSGLVLYWLVNNCLSVLQQWYITRQVEGNDIKKRVAANS